MIKSMTGFATATVEADGVTTTATVKSVNHRFLDLQLRLPTTLAAAEQGFRAIIQQRVARGRLEATLAVQLRRETTPIVELDEAFVSRVGAAIERAKTLGVVAGELQPGDLLRLPQALTVREAASQTPEEEAEGVRRTAEEALVASLEALDTMRRREGELLNQDLEQRRAMLAKSIEQVAAAAADGQAGRRARLLERLQELGLPVTLDPAALAQEVIRFVARSDIDEELVRFRAHLVHWGELVAGAEPCGRKLDFLLQELNREINTIGSKAEGLQVAPIVVHVKAELERMREQVQNIE
jgi:uncharacterized protein (TIGR00255 family)